MSIDTEGEDFAHQLHRISTVKTITYLDQLLNTNFTLEGLEKTELEFSFDHYVENFVQAAFNVMKFNKTALLVGGLGNEMSNGIMLKIVRIFAGNGIEKIYTGEGGLISRPAMSQAAVKHTCWGFLIHNSCHRLTKGDGRGCSMDLIGPDGGPINPDLFDDILVETQNLVEYKTVQTILTLDLFRGSNMLFKIGTTEMVVAVVDTYAVPDLFDDIVAETQNLVEYKTVQIILNLDLFWGSNMLFKIGTTEMVIAVVDTVHTVSDYTKLLEGIFHFGRINRLLNGSSHYRPFRIVVDCNHGGTGPYARRIFEEELGAGKGSVVKYEPTHDARSIDASSVGLTEVDNEMKSGICDLGASLDGDGGRCVIYGRRGFHIPPGESISVITSHFHAIPYFLKHKFNGVGRSFFTPSSVDDVTSKGNLVVLEAPGSWIYFNRMMDSKKILLCEDDHFGIGSHHVGVRDGIWNILAWLSLVVHFQKPVKDIMMDHWALYGHTFTTTYEFHNLPCHKISKVFAEMVNITFNVEDLVSSIREVGVETFTILDAGKFEFPYSSKREMSAENALRVLVEPKGRIIYRALALEDHGMIQIIVEVHNKTEPYCVNKSSVTESLFQFAMQLGKIVSGTGKNQPDLIY